MELTESLPYFLSATLLLLLVLPKLLTNWQPAGGRKKNRPPGPPSLPIIGHLHLVRDPVHRTLKALSDRYGPIFSISFGCRPVVVVSSTSALEECLVHKDVVFAGRPKLESWREISYNFTTIASATYGPHWRNLRRIATQNIFSRLDSFLAIRQDEMHLLLKSLRQSTGGGGGEFVKVGMRSRLRDLSFNVIMRMVAGKRFFGDEVKEEHAGEFKDIIAEAFEQAGAADPGDFVPLLRLVDINGRRKRTKETNSKLDVFFQRLIDERRNSNKNLDPKTMTIIDSMLELQSSEPQLYTDDTIKGLILVLLGAGTESASLTVEWAISVLLNNPDVLRKARSEVDDRVGHDRLVDESDVQNLPYIQNILTEVLRLFLPTPLLIPHEAMEDTTIGGFHIPKGTMLLVNAWAIHRDPKLWDDPTSFRPERHQELAAAANDPFRYLPYGVGRRSCPGAGYTNRLVGATLAALLQCFEWERIGIELVDLHEGTGMITPKAIPLQGSLQDSFFHGSSPLSPMN